MIYVDHGLCRRALRTFDSKSIGMSSALMPFSREYTRIASNSGPFL